MKPSSSYLPVHSRFRLADRIGEGPVFSLYTTVDATPQQAPYRWGEQENAAAMINGAESSASR